MRRLALALLAILVTPLMLLGLPFYFVPLIRTRGVVSGTAYEPMTARLTWHRLGTRDDPATEAIAHALPATNLGFDLLIMGPLLLICRLSGHTPKALRYPADPGAGFVGLMAARTGFIDELLARHGADVSQIVILGAGWDVRAWGLLGDSDARIFEVDTAPTQAVKRRAIEASGLAAERVTFIPCDFETQDWFDELQRAGLDASAPTIVLWEGVCMYLTDAAIDASFERFSRLAPGSLVLFDFLTDAWLESPTGQRAVRGAHTSYGETLRFGLPVAADFDARLERFVGERGLEVLRAKRLGPPDASGVPHDSVAGDAYGGLACLRVPAA